MLEAERARSISKTKAARLSPEELRDKIVTGVLYEDTQKPEFQRTYAEVSAGVRAQVGRRFAEEDEK